MITGELRHRLNQHAAKGGKTSRRRQVKRIYEFVDWCKCSPEQIGKKHVHQFFAKHEFAVSTERDYWYAIRLLWRLIGRSSDPPRPPQRKQAESKE